MQRKNRNARFFDIFLIFIVIFNLSNRLIFIRIKILIIFKTY